LKDQSGDEVRSGVWKMKSRKKKKKDLEGEVQRHEGRCDG
jgi:hypothetical protein